MTAPARPLYFRLLGVKHLRAGPVAAFVLFEGSIAAGALLALADVISWWGFIAIPVAVAAMVKIHDRVARALVQPLAVVQMSASRPLRDRRTIGWSAVPRPARLTTEIAGDDAVASPEARPDQRNLDPTAIGTAPVTSIGRAPVPGPGIRRREAPEAVEGSESPKGRESAKAPTSKAPTSNGPTSQGPTSNGPESQGPESAKGPEAPEGPEPAEGPPGPRSPSPTEQTDQTDQDPWFPIRAEPMAGRADRMDRLDPESRRGNQGHFD